MMPHLDALDVRSSHTGSIPAHIRIKNRRKTYLDRNPSYFRSPDLELSEPILYDRCIRRFQTAAEREADGQKKGYSGVLEAGLWLGEARQREREQPEPLSHEQNGDVEGPEHESRRGERSSTIEFEVETPKTKEEGFEIFKAEMTLRFLYGHDIEFDYRLVDENEDFDGVEQREQEEAWFDEEEPKWINDGAGNGTKGIDGETGVQDF